MKMVKIFLIFYMKTTFYVRTFNYKKVTGGKVV